MYSEADISLELAPSEVSDYACLDSGNGRRLERFGRWVLDRPAPGALWKPEHPERWTKAAAVFQRNTSGRGEWTFRRALPDCWTVRWDDLVFRVKPTAFGHLGLFPEHAAHWPWLRERIVGAPAPCRLLHLFAYTGSTSLYAARHGAQVCHLDAVPDINRWARENAGLSGMSEAPVRWIADDVMKFVNRERRRGKGYEGVVLDPPSFGRGTQGERWVLSEHLAELLDALLSIMRRDARFILLSGHADGMTPPAMRNLLQPWTAAFGGRIEAGTMVLEGADNRMRLPAGCFARWQIDSSGA